MFANWEEVFESFSEIEKITLRSIQAIALQNVVNEHWIYSRENFLWALSQKARVLQELKILLNSNEIKNLLIGRIKAYNNKGVCFVSYTPFLFSDDGEGHFIKIGEKTASSK